MRVKKNYYPFLLGVILLVITYAAHAQNGKSASGKHRIFLLLNVQKISEKDSGTIKHTLNLRPEIIFDKENAYYYYAFAGKKQWVQHQQYALTLKKNITSGYLYIFTVDAENIVKILQAISLDTVGKLSTINLYSLSKNNLLKHPGKEHLTIWFSKKPLPDNELISGIYMTHGDFISRNREQIGSTFAKMNGQWHFSKQHIGFYAADSFFNTKNNFIIPLITDFEIKPQPL